uniref:Uncharacterized protein n=1 Tax=Panagrolaimus sp. PS1159 TaxID=55785 RepID=A0AC35G820_9BILA
MSSSKHLHQSSRGSAEALTARSTSSVSTAVPPNYQPSPPFADTCEPNSYSDCSVRSECDHINNFHNNNNNTSLASVDTSKNITTRQIQELEKKRINGPLFDIRQPDFVNFHEGRLQSFPNAYGSKLLWHTTCDVFDIMIHGRQPSFEKHSDRVIPNPWRRFGTLTKLTKIGGWSTKRKKSICVEVKPGAPMPPPPNAPQMMVHRDPKRPIPFTYPSKSVPSEICAQNYALQIALRAENSWMGKSWYNPIRLHFMDPNHIHRSIAAAVETPTSKRQTVYTFPTNSRSHSTSSSAASTPSHSGESDCSTAVTGRFSDVSISSTSTATPNIRKVKKEK